MEHNRQSDPDNILGDLEVQDRWNRVDSMFLKAEFDV